MKIKVSILILALFFNNLTVSAAPNKPFELLESGAGRSGKVPKGLMTAPGISKQVSTVTISENFDDGDVSEWDLYLPSTTYPREPGSYPVVNGLLKYVPAPISGDSIKFLLTDVEADDQTAAVDVSPYANGYGGITIWQQDLDNWVDVFIYPAWGADSLWVIESIGGVWERYQYPATTSERVWHQLRIDADSTTGKIGIYIDDEFITAHDVSTQKRRGRAGVTSGNSGALFDNFSLTY